MARDGSGDYSRVVTPPANGDVANATDFNSEINDIASALSDSINKDGTKAMAANLPMGGFKITGLGTPTVGTDAVTKTYADGLTTIYQPLDATLTALAALSWSSGSPLVQFTAADTISLTLTPSVTSLQVEAGSTSATAIQGPSDPNTGIVFSSADVMDVVTGGTTRWRFSATGPLTSPGSHGIQVGDGTLSLPGLAFVQDPDNGSYRVGANNWDLVAGGVAVLDLTATVVKSPTLIDLRRATDVVTPVAASVGYIGTIIKAKNATYTIVANDNGQTLYHTSASAHTFTIDSNANLALPDGFMFKIRNDNGGGIVTIAITTDTLRWGSSTGSRSLAANGSATFIKQSPTSWFVEGTGLS